MFVETNKAKFSDDQLISMVEDHRERAIESYNEGDFDTAVFFLEIANVCANQLGYMNPLTMEQLIEASK